MERGVAIRSNTLVAEAPGGRWVCAGGVSCAWRTVCAYVWVPLHYGGARERGASTRGKLPNHLGAQDPVSADSTPGGQQHQTQPRDASPHPRLQANKGRKLANAGSTTAVYSPPGAHSSVHLRSRARDRALIIPRRSRRRSPRHGTWVLNCSRPANDTRARTHLRCAGTDLEELDVLENWF